MIRRKYVPMRYPRAKSAEAKELIARAKALAASRGVPMGAMIMDELAAFTSDPDPVESFGLSIRTDEGSFRLLVPRDREQEFGHLWTLLRIEALRQGVTTADIFFHILCKLEKEKN